MERITLKPLLLAAGLLAFMPMAQAASTLVYCSEASPAGFDPSQYTSGTEFDASAETVFNRLTQFKRGGTEVEPGLATRWEVSKDGLTYTFHLRDGVKFHTTDYFTPTRDFNADDVLFTFNRLLDADEPVPQGVPVRVALLHRHGHEHHDQKRRKTRRPHRALQPEQRRCRVRAEPGHELRLDAIGRIRRATVERRQSRATSTRSRWAPGRLCSSAIRRTRRFATSANKEYWKPEDVKLDNLIFSINPDAATAPAETQDRRMPGQRLPASAGH